MRLRRRVWLQAGERWPTLFRPSHDMPDTGRLLLRNAPAAGHTVPAFAETLLFTRASRPICLILPVDTAWGTHT